MDADLIVVGGGPVGAATAMFARRHGLRAIVLDRATFPRDKPCGEGLMPGGAAVLADLGVDLAAAGFPALGGVNYRIGAGGAGGTIVSRFRTGPGFGVRRLRLDALLAERAEVVGGVAVTAVLPRNGSVTVDTDRGRLDAPMVVGADGLRSQVRHWMGWHRPPGHPSRYALVGHFEAGESGPGPIVVTLLGDLEVYSAPAGGGELLVAVLGGRGRLRLAGAGVVESYLATAVRAHPELATAALRGRVRGAGPFMIRPVRVAGDGVFLAGDAAGFLDPLNGEAMSAGLAQARALAGFLAADPVTAAARYRAWHVDQWRRRWIVARLALTLTGSRFAARRALAGVRRRPAAMERLLEVNEGSRRLGGLRPRDWAALAGF